METPVSSVSENQKLLLELGTRLYDFIKARCDSIDQRIEFVEGRLNTHYDRLDNLLEGFGLVAKELEERRVLPRL